MPLRAAIILPVIHYADANQAMRNAERAAAAGCAGVMLIDMTLRDSTGPIFAGAAVKHRWPQLHVGINHLRQDDPVAAVHDSVGMVDSTWTDRQLTHSGLADEVDARRVRDVLRVAPPHALFCAVALKYQQHEPFPGFAANRAIEHGFIPTTSGPATGEAADPSVIAAIRNSIGPDAPLAIASGVTPENAHRFLPLVSHVLVATGVSASFFEFDPAMLHALVAVHRDLSAR